MALKFCGYRPHTRKVLWVYEHTSTVPLPDLYLKYIRLAQPEPSLQAYCAAINYNRITTNLQPTSVNLTDAFQPFHTPCSIGSELKSYTILSSKITKIL